MYYNIVNTKLVFENLKIKQEEEPKTTIFGLELGYCIVLTASTLYLKLIETQHCLPILV